MLAGSDALWRHLRTGCMDFLVPPSGDGRATLAGLVDGGGAAASSPWPIAVMGAALVVGALLLALRPSWGEVLWDHVWKKGRLGEILGRDSARATRFLARYFPWLMGAIGVVFVLGPVLLFG